MMTSAQRSVVADLVGEQHFDQAIEVCRSLSSPAALIIRRYRAYRLMREELFDLCDDLFFDQLESGLSEDREAYTNACDEYNTIGHMSEHWRVKWFEWTGEEAP